MLKFIKSTLIIVCSLTLISCIIPPMKTSKTSQNSQLHRLWQLSHVNGKSIGDGTEVRFTLDLTNKKTAQGIVACNQWNGNYEITEVKETHGAEGSHEPAPKKLLSISQPISTRMLCHTHNQLQAQVQADFFGALKNATISSLSKDQLILQMNNQEQWQFKAAQH